MDYKHLGLFSVVLLVVGLTFVAIRWSQGKDLTFSQIVAKQKQSIIFYSILFAVVLPILIVFFIGWFTPTFSLTILFNILVILSAITQFTCTLVPEVGGTRTTYHRFLAGLSAILLPPTLAIVALSDSFTSVIKVLSVVSLLVMIGIIVTLAKNDGKNKHLLILQSLYFTAFFIPTLVATYTS